MAKEIPQGEWEHFLADFTHANEGRRAVLDVGDKHIGQAEGEEAFILTGVEAGVEATDEDTIVVEMADLQGEDEDHVTHSFEDVQTLRLREHQGAIEGLEIETKDGTKGILHLHEAIPVRQG